VSTSASRYTAEIHLEDANDAHSLAVARVPANSRVLDLGAADGSVAAVLRQMGCRVSAVECDPVAAEVAGRWCDRVVVADLNEIKLDEVFAGEQFDVILMLDVLEHLVEPEIVLRGARDVLAPDGWCVISLPNVSHLSVRLALLDGRFRYTDVGLLDRTHLRFYDSEGKDALLRDAGWEQLALTRVTRTLGTTEITVDDADPVLLAQLEADPEALTYQFVITAVPTGSPRLTSPPVLPAAVAQEALVAANRRVHELEASVARLEALLSAADERAVPDLLERLEAIRMASIVRRGHLQHLLAALEENLQRLRSVGGG